MQLQRNVSCTDAAHILQMIRPHNRHPKFERKYQNLGDERPGDQDVGKRTTRQAQGIKCGCLRERAPTKLKRSQGLSVTLPKLQSNSGSGGNNLELVKNSLKSLELPQM